MRCDSALHEPIGEAIGLALDRGIEHLDRVRISLVREQGALRVQREAGRFHLFAHGCWLDPMQRLGGARARPGRGGVVHDDVDPTGLQTASTFSRPGSFASVCIQPTGSFLKWATSAGTKL